MVRPALDLQYQTMSNSVKLNISVIKPSEKDEWNAFVSNSKQGTFLFDRRYMDYHVDRFDDFSLIVRDQNEQIIALLPANIDGDQLVSHGGLTYGGFITDVKMTVSRMKTVFDSVIEFLVDHGVSAIDYKSVPSIYHTAPAEEDLYCLYSRGAGIYRRDVLSVIDYSNQFSYQSRRQRAIKKAVRTGLNVTQTTDFHSFWAILKRNLLKRYGVDPVHNADEIELLAKKFPQQIKLYGAYDRSGVNILAGCVVYESRNVCHVQYNAASPEGKQMGAQDLIMDFLIRDNSQFKKYFDFGISTEKNGRYLNKGLVEYKEGFGAKTIVHDFYHLNLSP